MECSEEEEAVEQCEEGVSWWPGREIGVRHGSSGPVGALIWSSTDGMVSVQYANAAATAPGEVAKMSRWFCGSRKMGMELVRPSGNRHDGLGGGVAGGCLLVGGTNPRGGVRSSSSPASLNLEETVSSTDADLES
jgi:hypothetical protein